MATKFLWSVDFVSSGGTTTVYAAAADVASGVALVLESPSVPEKWDYFRVSPITDSVVIAP